MEELINMRENESTEKVPVGYAVERLMSGIKSEGFRSSRQWLQRLLKDDLSLDLQIVKAGNRYVCNKQWADGMDFKLWFFNK